MSAAKPSSPKKNSAKWIHIPHITVQGDRFVFYIEDGKEVKNWQNAPSHSLIQEALKAQCGLSGRRRRSGYIDWSLDQGRTAQKNQNETQKEGFDFSPEEPDMSSFLKSVYALKPPSIIFSELNWRTLMRNIRRGCTTLLVGPSGTGKSKSVAEAAKVLKRPFFSFNLGATQDPRGVLIGNTHFDKSRGTFFAKSRFVRALETQNAVILLDELTRAHPETWNILLTVLDAEQGYLSLDESETTEIVKVSKGVSFVATANVGTEYTATRMLDRAITDRLMVLEIPALDAKQEVMLLKHHVPGLAESSLQTIAEIVCATRQEIQSESPKLSVALSARDSLAMARLVQDGYSIQEAVGTVAYPKYSEEGGLDSERTFFKQLAQRFYDTEFGDNLFDKQLQEEDCYCMMILMDYGEDQSCCMELIRSLTVMGPRKAKGFVNALPQVFGSAPYEAALDIQHDFETIGATVKLVEYGDEPESSPFK